MFAAGLPTNEAAKLMFVDRVRDKLLLVSRAARPCKGARSLVQHLYRYNVPMAITTNSSIFSFNLKRLGNESMLDVIPTVVCGDSPGLEGTTGGKHHPSMYLATAKAMGRKPSECLVFERSYTAAKAARAAGMRVVVVTDEAAKFQNLATGTVPSLTDFDAMIWKLIPSNSLERTFTGTGTHTTASSNDATHEPDMIEPASPSPHTPHPGHTSFRRKSDPPSPNTSPQGVARRGSVGKRSSRRVSIKVRVETTSIPQDQYQRSRPQPFMSIPIPNTHTRTLAHNTHAHAHAPRAFSGTMISTSSSRV